MRSFSALDVEVFVQGVPHPEGIAFGAEGWLYTGGALPDYKGAGPIYRISPDGRKIETFADTGGRVLGLAFNQYGDLYVCDSKLSAVFRIEPNGTVHLFDNYGGNRKMLMPNFLVFDSEGCLYVSDSGTAKAGEPTGSIFRFTPDGKGKVFLDGLIFANGLALSSNEDALFVVETYDDRVLHVPIRRDGTAGKPEVYADKLQTGPDGLALDAAGNLYVTVTRTNQIVCVAPTGEQISLVIDSTGERIYAPSNLAFGAPQDRGLYIANLFGTHISRLVIENVGMPLSRRGAVKAGASDEG